MPRHLGQLVHRHAAARGDALALTDGTRSITYAELERTTDTLARRLIADGLRPGDRVFVLAAKDLTVPVLALATWKAGGVFAPVDPAQPAARLASLYDRVDPHFVVAPDRHAFAPDGADVVSLSTMWDRAGGESKSDAPLPDIGPDAPATLIFTSGSTGHPKGVLLSHRNGASFLAGEDGRLGLDASSRVMSFAPFFFDVSFVDTYLPLSVGASVFMARGLPIPSKHLAAARSFEVTHLMAIATVLNILSGEPGQLEAAGLDALRAVITGAEVPDKDVVVRWMRAYPGIAVFNLYGPTECSVAQLLHRIEDPDEDRDGVYPIGTPLSTVEVRLEDEAGDPITRPEETGEILLGGPQVMLGYWRDPASTAAALAVRDGTRYYRTGDYGFFDDRGRYHFAGRRDHEIKLNGRRINLLEVATRLRTAPGVRHPYVTTVGHGAERAIVALVMTEAGLDDEAGTMRALREARSALREVLPEYMLPKYLVAYDRARTTGSGKLAFDGPLGDFARRFVPGPIQYFGLFDSEVRPLTAESPRGAPQ